MFKFIPFLFLSFGLFLMVQVALPVISFKYLEEAYAKDALPLISPQSSGKVLGISIEDKEGDFSQIISTTRRDTKAAYTHFSLSIPGAGISDELVYVDSNDLSLGLIQLPGSALPGEKGNLFISGHSMLPQFFIKGEKAIFSKLPNVKRGDIITASALGTKFTYKVVEIKVVKPDDISVISPPDNTGRYISLMTCVPPGLNTKRLIVIGKLI